MVLQVLLFVLSSNGKQLRAEVKRVSSSVASFTFHPKNDTQYPKNSVILIWQMVNM